MPFRFGTFMMLYRTTRHIVVMKTLESEWYLNIKACRFTVFEILMNFFCIVIILCIRTIPTNRVYRLDDTVVSLHCSGYKSGKVNETCHILAARMCCAFFVICCWLLPAMQVSTLWMGCGGVIWNNFVYTSQINLAIIFSCTWMQAGLRRGLWSFN